MDNSTVFLISALAAAIGAFFGVFIVKARILWAPGSEIEYLNAILRHIKRAYKRRTSKAPRNMEALYNFLKEAL